MCVCVCAWVRARRSLDGWCMFVWCEPRVSYAGWDGSTCMWVRHF